MSGVAKPVKLYAVQMWVICPHCKNNLNSPSVGGLSYVWTGEELEKFAGKRIKHAKCGGIVILPKFVEHLNNPEEG